MAETEQTAAQEEQAAGQKEQDASQAGEQNPTVQEAEFAKVEGRDSAGGEEHLDMLLDIQLPVTVSLGKAEMPLRRLLQLQPGSVLSLEKRIGEPVELIVQEIPFATGDIVIVEDYYAVRIREILSNPAMVSVEGKSEK